MIDIQNLETAIFEREVKVLNELINAIERYIDSWSNYVDMNTTDECTSVTFETEYLEVFTEYLVRKSFEIDQLCDERCF